MKWMDLSLSMPGCSMGIYARDAVYLHDLPRLTDHVFIGAANRCSQPELAARHVMAWPAMPDRPHLPGAATEAASYPHWGCREPRCRRPWTLC